MAVPAGKGRERNGVDRLPETYDMIPHNWIKECFELFGIVENVARFLEDSIMENRVDEL